MRVWGRVLKGLYLPEFIDSRRYMSMFCRCIFISINHLDRHLCAWNTLSTRHGSDAGCYGLIRCSW